MFCNGFFLLLCQCVRKASLKVVKAYTEKRYILYIQSQGHSPKVFRLNEPSPVNGSSMRDSMIGSFKVFIVLDGNTIMVLLNG